MPDIQDDLRHLQFETYPQFVDDLFLNVSIYFNSAAMSPILWFLIMVDSQDG